MKADARFDSFIPIAAFLANPTVMNHPMRFLIALFLLGLPIPFFADAVSNPIPKQGWNISLGAPPFAGEQGEQQGPNYLYQANSDRSTLTLHRCRRR
jgi:hypothetical protein